MRWLRCGFLFYFWRSQAPWRAGSKRALGGRIFASLSTCLRTKPQPYWEGVAQQNSTNSRDLILASHQTLGADALSFVSLHDASLALLWSSGWKRGAACLLCVSICVVAILCVCSVYAQVYVCVQARDQRWVLSGVIHLIFRTVSLIGPELTSLASPSVWGVPGVLLSQSPQFWDYRCYTITSRFLSGL